MNFTTTIISKAVQGKVLAENEVTVTGVEFDSRKIEAGDLFVPLQGTNDGHEFVAKAIENGATATLWSRDPATAPEDSEGYLVGFTSISKLLFTGRKSRCDRDYRFEW